MNELGYDEIIEIHSKTLARHGGLPGVKNEGFLLSALDQPKMSVFGEDAYPSITDKAAALGFSFAKNHAFHDGNKRVAFLAMFVFLYKNGYLLEVPEEEAIRFMLSVADGTKNVQREDIALWLESHIEPLGEEEYEEVAVPTSFGEISPISEKAKQIEAERPPYWKWKMFVQVLTDEIEKYAEIREEHKKGIFSGPKRSFTYLGLFSWFDSVLESKEQILENQEKALNFLAKEAFFESESGGDIDFMLDFARELGATYKKAIVWSQQFRQVDMPVEFQSLLDYMANYSNGFITQIEQLPQMFLDGYKIAETWDKDEPYRFSIELGYSVDEEESKKEIQDLKKKLGLADENGVSCSEHVAKSFSIFNGISVFQLQEVDKYTQKYILWRKSYLALENRPKSISKPQRIAIAKSLSQCTIALTKTLKVINQDLTTCVETLEVNGPLLSNLVWAESQEAIQSAIDNLITLAEFFESCENTIDLITDVETYIESAEKSFPILNQGAEELLGVLNEHKLLLKRFADACSITTNMIKSKLEVVDTATSN